MDNWSVILVLSLSYLIGSIPMGMVFVKIATGQDVRKIQSGRTGGTNAMRAAGFGIGLLTTIADISKGVIAVWLARSFTPGNIWVEVFAPALVVLGHNYSIYLIHKDDQGRLRLKGGAGGAPSVGGAVGYWAPSVFILVPLGALILFGAGYASVATFSVPIIGAIIFAVRAWMGISPWEYLAYFLIAEILILWSLRPNIKRLFKGTERVVGWRAKRRESKKNSDNPPNQATNFPDTDLFADNTKRRSSTY